MCGVTRHAIGNVFRGAMPSGALLQRFSGAGADVQYVLTGRRAGTIDVNLLGLAEAALRLAYEELRPDGARGAIRARMSALVYNQALRHLPLDGDETATLRALAMVMLDSLDDPADPEMLARNLFVNLPEPSAATGVAVTGNRNRVAGRDMIENAAPKGRKR